MACLAQCSLTCPFVSSLLLKVEREVVSEGRLQLNLHCSFLPEEERERVALASRSRPPPHLENLICSVKGLDRDCHRLAIDKVDLHGDILVCNATRCLSHDSHME